MLWLLLLPLRLAFGLVFGVLLLPFFIVRVVLKLAVGLLLLPIVLLAVLVGLLVAGTLSFAVLIPLAPLFVVLLLAWALVSPFRRPFRSAF